MNLKRFALSAALLAVLSVFLNVSLVRAEEPMGLISLGSYETLGDNVEVLGKMLENPQLGLTFSSLETILGNDFMEGFDKTKPMGIAFYPDPETKNSVFPLFFVPQKNANLLAEKVAQYQNADVDDEYEEGDLTLIKIDFDSAPFYVRAANGWTFLSTNSKALAKLPKNPEKMLAGLSDQYVLAVKLDVEKTPKELKAWMLSQIKMGLDTAKAIQAMSADADDADDADDNAGMNAVEKLQNLNSSAQLSFDDVKKVVDNSRNFTLGLKLNADKETMNWQIHFVVKEGSEMGKVMSDLAGAKLYANCLLDDASLCVGSVTKNLPSTVEKTKQQLAQVKDLVFEMLDEQGISKTIDSEKLEQAKKLADKTLDVLNKALDRSVNQKVLSGAALFFQPKNVSFVSANMTCEPKELDQLIKDWVKLTVPEGAEKDVINWDAETWEGLTFSTFTFPVEKITAKLREADTDEANSFADWMESVYGDSIVLAYAHSDSSLFLAGGNDPVALIKTVVNNGKATAPEDTQEYIVLHLGQTLDTISKLPIIEESMRDQLSMVAVAAQGEDNADKLVIRSSYGKNSYTGTMEMDKGLLRAINAMIMIYMMNNM